MGPVRRTCEVCEQPVLRLGDRGREMIVVNEIPDSAAGEWVLTGGYVRMRDNTVLPECEKVGQPLFADHSVTLYKEHPHR